MSLRGRGIKIFSGSGKFLPFNDVELTPSYLLKKSGLGHDIGARQPTKKTAIPTRNDRFLREPDRQVFTVTVQVPFVATDLLELTLRFQPAG